MTTLELAPELVIDLEADEPRKLVVDGRYDIYPSPDADKPKRYTRSTTWAGTLEDTARLDAYRARMVAIGLSKRPDLVELFIATPETDRDTLNTLVDRAIEAAGGDARANRGTAAHGFLARLLTGEPVDVPDSIRHDVEQALARLQRAGLTPLSDMIEVCVVCAAIGVAGQVDIICANRDGELVVVDWKTGDGLEEYARLKTSIQLAVYAHAETIYDPATKTHRPMPAVRKDIAYALHRPLGTDTCQLIKVDIAAGWRYASFAVPVVKDARNHGKRKRDCLFEIIPDVEQPADYCRQCDLDKHICPGCGTSVPHGTIACAECAALAHEPTHIRQTLRDWVLARLDEVSKVPAARQTMKEMWPADIPKLSSGHPHSEAELRRLAGCLDAVERSFELPFNPDPTVDRTTPAQPAEVEPTPLVDEGDRIGDADLTGIKATLDRLPVEQRAVLESWAKEANAAGRSFSIKQKPSQRRYAIYQALIAVAPLIDEDLERVRATIAAVIPDAAMPAVPLGSAIGALTIAEADLLRDLALAIRVDEPALQYGLDGAVRWATPNHPDHQAKDNA